MKVRYTPPGTAILDNQPFIERKMDFAGGQQSFEQSFSASGREQYEQTIAELAKKIDEQGAQLAKKINIGELDRYRALVSDLLSEVVSHAYAFNKENTFDPRGRRKVYATIQKINEKLEEMAGDILHGNQDALRILSMIDDIRGLIVDIFL